MVENYSSFHCFYACVSSWLFALWLRIPVWSLNTGHAIRKCGPGVYKSAKLINSSVSQYFLFVCCAQGVNQTSWWIIRSLLKCCQHLVWHNLTTICQEPNAYSLWTVALKMYAAVFRLAMTPAGTMTSRRHRWCSYLALCRNIIASESFSPDSSFILWPTSSPLRPLHLSISLPVVV